VEAATVEATATVQAAKERKQQQHEHAVKRLKHLMAATV
jgi:hypothetical protein